MLTAEQARTLAFGQGLEVAEALKALETLGRLHGIDDPTKARRLVRAACDIHREMALARAILLISAKRRRLDYIPLGTGDYESGAYRLAVAVANGLRAKQRKALATHFCPEVPRAPLTGPWRLEEIALDLDGQRRELRKEMLPLGEWGPDNRLYQSVLQDCFNALGRHKQRNQRS